MATTEDNVKTIHDLVLADRRLKVREIAETVGISIDRVGHILHEKAVGAIGGPFAHSGQQAQP